MWEATGATDLGADRPGAAQRNPLLKNRVRTPNRYRAFRGKKRVRQCTVRGLVFGRKKTHSSQYAGDGGKYF